MAQVPYSEKRQDILQFVTGQTTIVLNSNNNHSTLLSIYLRFTVLYQATHTSQCYSLYQTLLNLNVTICIGQDILNADVFIRQQFLNVVILYLRI